MTPDRTSIVSDLCDRVARIVYLEPDAVNEASRYADELMLESSGAVQLLVELEERYGLRVGDDEARALETIGQTADLILLKLSQTGGDGT